MKALCILLALYPTPIVKNIYNGNWAGYNWFDCLPNKSAGTGLELPFLYHKSLQK